MFDLRNWLKKTANSPRGFLKRPQIICADGTLLSIRANKNSLCKPRENLADGNYETVEFRDLSYGKDALVDYYCIDSQFSIYANVPIAIVEAYIEKHGGYLATKTY